MSQELLNTDLERYLTHNSRNHASWWTADVSRNDSLTNMTDDILSSTRLTENMTGILSPAKEAEMTSIFSRGAYTYLYYNVLSNFKSFKQYIEFHSISCFFLIFNFFYWHTSFSSLTQILTFSFLFSLVRLIYFLILFSFSFPFLKDIKKSLSKNVSPQLIKK